MGNKQSTEYPLDDLSEEAQNRSINLLLLGRTGTGKSSTGNTLLQLTNNPFICDDTDASVTIECKGDYSQFEGRDIKVVDMPGLSDANKNEEENIKLVVGAAMNAVAETPHGYDAVLVVVQYGRQTNDDTTTYEQLKDLFGHDVFKQYGILVVTRGDDFKRGRGRSQTFKDYCSQQTGQIKKWWEKCNERAVLFDNITEDKDEIEAQRKNLFDIVDTMRSRERYTPELFMAAKATREELIKKAEDMVLTDALKKKLRFIMHDLRDVDVDSPEEAMQQLIQIEKRAEMMTEEIKIQAEKAKALKNVLSFAEEIFRAVQMKQDLVHSVIKCQAKKEVRNKIIERLRIQGGEVSSFQTESEKEYEKGASEIKKKKEKMNDAESQLDNKYFALLQKDETKKKISQTIALELLFIVAPAALGAVSGIGAGVGVGIAARALMPMAARGLAWTTMALVSLFTNASTRAAMSKIFNRK